VVLNGILKTAMTIQECLVLRLEIMLHHLLGVGLEDVGEAAVLGSDEMAGKWVHVCYRVVSVVPS
jgi:hypothetical protein